MTSKTGAIDSTGSPNSVTTFSLPYSGSGNNGGFDSVIRAVSVGGNIYNYYYDGSNRRVRKQYPSGAAEDFFYTPSGEMISERSFTQSTNAQGNTVDEYIWLNGVVIASIRSVFTAEMGRFADWDGFTIQDVWGGVCPRRNENARCGLYWLHPDRLGRPTYALDKNFKLDGAGEYDPFGALNHVALQSETPHPMPLNQTATLATSVSRDKFYYALRARIRAGFVETALYSTGERRPGFSWDSLVVTAGSMTLWSSFGGFRGAAVSSWFPVDSTFNVSFISDAAYPTDGAVLNGWDYQRIEVPTNAVTTSMPYFPSIRFPGQYYDDETNLHENWNRYYDPLLGRYLSPEPLLQSPAYLSTMARSGMSVPTYAYAANNPLRYVDSTGLAPGDWFPSAESAARDAFAWIDQNQFTLATVGEVGTNIYPVSSGVGPLEPNRRGYTYDAPVPLGKTGGSLPSSKNACADIHNHWSGNFPSADDLIGWLGRSQQNGLPYTGFVSNNRWGYFRAPVAKSPYVPANQLPPRALRNYFGPQVDGAPIGGGLQWW